MNLTVLIRANTTEAALRQRLANATDHQLLALPDTEHAIRWAEAHPDKAQRIVLGAAIEQPLWAAAWLRLLQPSAAIILLSTTDEAERLQRCLEATQLPGTQTLLADPPPHELAPAILRARPVPHSTRPQQFAASLLSAQPCPVLSLDDALRICIASPSVQPLLGRSPRALAGRPITDAFHPSDHERLEAFLRTARNRSSSPRTSAFHIRGLNGNGPRPVDLSPRPWLIDGKPHGLILNLSDAEPAAQARRASEGWLKQGIDAVDAGVYLVDATGRITHFNQKAAEIWGRAPNLNDPIERFCGSFRIYNAECQWVPHESCPMARVLETGQAVQAEEVIFEKPDGTWVTALANASPLRDEAGRLIGAVNCLVDITDRKQAEQQLKMRVAQQAAVAHLGQRALVGEPLDPLFNRAARTVAEALETDLSKVLELQQDGEIVLLRAGHGWHEGQVGRATEDTHTGSQAGYTLQSNMPVISEDLRRETRFTPSPLLREHGAVSGISVVISGPRGKPWGVLAAHSTQPRHFTRDDLNFLQAVANVLAEAIQHHQAEQAVRGSERRFRALFEQAAVGLGEIDAEGRGINANDRFCQITGYRREELLAMDNPIERLTHPEDTTASRERLNRLLQGEIDSYQAEKRYVRKDGQIVWVRATTSAIHDEDGRLERMLGVIEDITDRKRAEEAQARLAAIVTSSNDAIIGTTPDGYVTSWNRGAQQLYGYTAEEAVGQPISIIVPEDRRHEIQQILDRLRRNERTEQLDTVRTHKDSSPRNVSLTVSPMHDAQGRWIGTASITRDITERKKAEKSLLASERRERARAEELATVMEAVPAIVVIAHDGDGKRLTGNRASYELLRLPMDTNISLTAPPHERPRNYTMHYDGRELRPDELPIQRAARGEEIEGCEFWVVFEQGDNRCLYGNAVPLRDANGEPRGSVGAFIDITERKRLMERLEQINHELEHRVSARTAELEHRAHQLRRLTSQLTEAEQRERQKLAQVLHDHLQQILVAAKMQAGLLNTPLHPDSVTQTASQLCHMLDEAIESSRSLSHELSPQVLYDLGLGPALEWLAPRTEDKYGLTVHVQTDENAEPAGEPVRVLLFQAVRELLLNVVKHARTHEAWVRMTRYPEDRVRITVEDHGTGFNPEQLEQGGGEQLGLFGLRERLEVLGGELQIHSTPDTGTTVTLLASLHANLPQHDDTTPEPLHNNPPAETSTTSTSESTDPAPEQARTIRVLLADDHRVVREGLARLLATEPDLQLIGQAENGREAVTLTEQMKPDVVVMDVSMPELSGIDATRQIHQQSPDTVVIGLSMHEPETMANAMREAGASGYLGKQIAATELTDVIRRHTSSTATH